MPEPSDPSRHLGRWLLGGLLAVVLILGAAVAVFARDWLAIPGLILQMTGQQVADSAPALPSLHVAPGDAAGAGASANPTDAAAAAASGGADGSPSSGDAPAPSLLPNRPFNVLLLGSDNDLKFASEAVLTQSMILLHIDPSTHQVAMVSIPRDFWVPINGYGNQKIDVAYEVGGIALARRTVSQLFGLNIDYYAWVGLDGLVQVIDTLNGVDVTVQHPILDEMYPDDLNTDDPYAYFRLYIPAGPQHLDGTTALEYVRSRHGDLQSDFGRSARQQQVLLALKNDLQDPGVASKLPQLVSSLQGAVKTDMTVPALAQLALLGKNVTAADIHRQVLSAPEFATLGNSPDGTEQVVFPDWDAIRTEMARVFDLHAPQVSDDLAQQVWQEQQPVRVLNGTGEAGLANAFSSYLAWQGYQVQATGNADPSLGTASKVMVQGPVTGTARALAALLNVSVTTTSQAQGGSVNGITVIVGAGHPSVPSAMLNLPSTIPPQQQQQIALTPESTPAPVPTATVSVTRTKTPAVPSTSPTAILRSARATPTPAPTVPAAVPRRVIAEPTLPDEPPATPAPAVRAVQAATATPPLAPRATAVPAATATAVPTRVPATTPPTPPPAARSPTPHG